MWAYAPMYTKFVRNILDKGEKTIVVVRYPVIFSKEGNEGESWGIRQLTTTNPQSVAGFKRIHM